MFTLPLLLGLALGVRHAADADHVATIASVVVGRRSLPGALRVAVFWGVGHSLTFLAVGLGIVLFGLQLPASFELIVEALIASTLLALGTLQVQRAFAQPTRSHAPHAARPLALGLMHGLAGSAAIALLALSTIESQLHALLYLTLFALGTLAGMLLITLAIAWSFRLSQSGTRGERALVLITGAASVACGLLIFGQLLTAH